jgi:hypothetical protein
VSDSQTTQPDSPQVPDAAIPLDKPATLQRLRKSRSEDLCSTSAHDGLAAAAAATDNTRATPLPHCKAVATHACTQHSGAHKTRAITHKLSQAALRGHTAATARRGAATDTRQHKSAIAILRHSTLVAALETAAAMHAQDAHCTSSACSQCAHNTAAKVVTFSQSWEQLTHIPTR